MLEGPQALRQDIGQLLGRGAKHGSIDAPRDTLTQLIGMAQNVLGLAKSHGISSKIKGSTVVQVQRSRARDRRAKIELKKVTGVHAFARGEGGSKSLGLSTSAVDAETDFWRRDHQTTRHPQ